MEKLDEMGRCVQVPRKKQGGLFSMKICANGFQRSHRKHSISGIFLPEDERETGYPRRMEDKNMSSVDAMERSHVKQSQPET